MYTLRTIYRVANNWQEIGVETNEMLGHCYTTIMKDRSPSKFEEELKRNGWADADKIYALLRNPEGYFHPLYSWADHFIMTESGKAFERI